MRSTHKLLWEEVLTLMLGHSLALFRGKKKKKGGVGEAEGQREKSNILFHVHLCIVHIAIVPKHLSVPTKCKLLKISF